MQRHGLATIWPLEYLINSLLMMI